MITGAAQGMHERIDTAALSRTDLDSVFIELRSDLERAARRRLNSPDLAADIVQDIYLRWQRVDRAFHSRPDARAYLYRMVANLAIDHRKVEARRYEILASAEPLHSALADSPESYALAGDHAKHIEEALKELPKHCRQILILNRLHGMTHKEIAKQLGVSTSLVEKHAVRALLHVRSRLGSLDELD